MNKVVLIGRLTGDPEVRYNVDMAFASYVLAVDRRFKQDGGATADFIRCVTFGKGAQFAEKYLKKGIKICVCGRLQTGSYTNKNGLKVYTTDIVVEEQEFVESKKKQDTDQSDPQGVPVQEAADNGFMQVPDWVQDEELPFS